MNYLSLMGCSALFATVLVAAYTIYNKYLANPDEEGEIRGQIVKVCRGGAIEIKLEDNIVVQSGQIFTVYKKMKLQEIVSVKKRRKTQTLLTPVGQGASSLCVQWSRCLPVSSHRWLFMQSTGRRFGHCNW